MVSPRSDYPKSVAKLEEKPYQLSQNKSKFLEEQKLNPTQNYTYFLPAAELPILVKHYEEKHGIKIFINGETGFGQESIAKNQRVLKKSIEELKQPGSKYAAFFIEHWIPKGYGSNHDDLEISCSFGSKFKNCHDLLRVDIIPFIDDKAFIKKNLSVRERAKLNEVVQRFNCKSLIDKCIELDLKEKSKAFNSMSLDKQQAIAEIKFIQKLLKEGEYVGYIFTNADRVRAQHFEFIIISAKQLIRPIVMNIPAQRTFTNIDFPKMGITYTGDWIVCCDTQDQREVNMPAPQAGRYECGTLGLLYLKELLKNDAEQIKEYSLLIPHYNRLTGLEYWFFPSPQPLRYSQSSFYNKILRVALLPIDDYVDIKHKGATYTIRTLQSILKETIQETHSWSKARAECKKALDALPEFSERWLKEFEKSSFKRNSMTPPGGKNQYLTYMTDHIKKLTR